MTMQIDVNGVALEVEDRGDGSPVLLLHGWPDTHDLWRHQVEALVANGYRTIAPDMRGTGASQILDGVDAYGVASLVGDVLGLLDALDVDRPHVVGHDWGALVGWVLAAIAPDRVASLAALSVGHPAAFAEAGWKQRQRAWHTLLFQFEGVAETWLAADDFANLRDWSAHPDIDAVVARLADPAALTAGLNVYRANVAPETLIRSTLELPPVTAPTMGVWGSNDIGLTEAAMTGSAAHVTGPWRYERLEGLGHWPMLEAPDLTSALLLEFLATSTRDGERAAC